MPDRKDVAILRDELNTAAEVLNRTTEKLTEGNAELSVAQQKLNVLTFDLTAANVEINRAKQELEREQSRILIALKADITQIKDATIALEIAVNELEAGTDLTRRSVESLVTTQDEQ